MWVWRRSYSEGPAGAGVFFPNTSACRVRCLPAMVSNVFEAAGGEATFRLLVERFYAGVAADPVLRPLYPEDDLTGPAERLTLFLIQYWGGPETYNETRGHPRLRMRHQPFATGQRDREAWLKQMVDAVNSLDIPRGVRDAFLDSFRSASHAMVHRPGYAAQRPPPP